MIEKTLDGHKVVFYDGIEDLPIAQFHKYGKFLLVEGGVGDTITDIDRHIEKLMNFRDDEKKFRKELLNLRQCLYVVATEQDIHYKTTLCLVKSVDGKDWEDFSDSGIAELYGLLNGARVKEMDELASKVRSAIDENLIQYFPSMFEDSRSKNYTDLLRKRALLQLRAIVNGDDNKAEIEGVTKSIFKMQSPQSFMGEENAEVKFDKQFEDMCLVMAKEFGGGIKKFTTMEFYTAYERLVKEGEEMKKIRNKRR